MLLAAPCAAYAQDAVSGLNGKAGVAAGENNSSYAEGSLAFPIGRRYGGQIDGVIGDQDASVKGLGAQLFWRDPTRGLLGITGSYLEAGSVGVKRAGLAGEWYVSRFTLDGQLGTQGGDVESHGYGSMFARYYLTDNIMVRAGMTSVESRERAHVDFEWQPAFSFAPGLSVFAKAGGDGDSDYVFAGVRYYFAGRKTLVRRHREDDPANSVVDSLASNAEAIAAARRRQCPTTTQLGNVQAPIDIMDPMGNIIAVIPGQREVLSVDCNGRVVETRIESFG